MPRVHRTLRLSADFDDVQRRPRRGQRLPVSIASINDVELGESPDITKQPMPWRAQQLKFRQHEVYTTFSTFSRFLRNEPTLELETIDDAPYHKESWMPSQGLSKVRCDDDVILAGHSFGGCTILSVLSSEPLNGFPPIPVNRTIVLDPWLEPLPTPGPVPFSMSSSPEISESEAAVKEHAISSSDSSTQIGSAPPRMLVINSEQFTVWKDHYARLKEVVVGWEPKGGRLVTLVGSRHQAFSDFPVLPFVGRKKNYFFMDKIAQISLSFLDNKLEETIKELPVIELQEEIVGVKKDGKPKRKIIGKVGDIIVE